jgi:hypothetical protein
VLHSDTLLQLSISYLMDGLMNIFSHLYISAPGFMTAICCKVYQLYVLADHLKKLIHFSQCFYKKIYICGAFSIKKLFSYFELTAQ